MYFSALAEELKREYGKFVEVELIVVGGGSILLNYDFRGSTMCYPNKEHWMPDDKTRRK